MVRLKVLDNETFISGEEDFNSNMVRLKACTFAFICEHYLNFNSNMVRLKAIEDIFFRSSKIFQFQHGAIKGSVGNFCLCNLSNFNSNMVRLKVGSFATR